MLAKKFKLPVQSFIDLHPKTFFQAYFTIKKAPNRFPYPRLAVVVGKRVSESAVKRNKIRRAVYEGINEIFSSPSSKLQSEDILIIVKPEIKKITPKEISSLIKNYLVNKNNV